MCNDFVYVRRERDSLFWRVFLDSDYQENFLDFLPSEAIQQRLVYIKEFYQRTDDEVEEQFIQRPDIYLTEEEMDRFVNEGVVELHRAYRYLEEGPDISAISSILEMGLLQLGKSS